MNISHDQINGEGGGGVSISYWFLQGLFLQDFGKSHHTEVTFGSNK